MVTALRSIEVNVVDARPMSDEGKWVDNPHYDPELKMGPNSLQRHWRAKYTILWPSNIHEPIEKQFATVTQIGDD